MKFFFCCLVIMKRLILACQATNESRSLILTKVENKLSIIQQSCFYSSCILTMNNLACEALHSILLGQYDVWVMEPLSDQLRCQVKQTDVLLILKQFCLKLERIFSMLERIIRIFSRILLFSGRIQSFSVPSILNFSLT